MSAIAHWIEQHGISTVVVGLVRLHLQKIRPPRALWVPFELGRPIGGPGDAVCQQSVLQQALHLVENKEPGQITDCELEDSRAKVDENWRAPTAPQADSVVSECSALKAAYERQYLQSGRTSVGVAGVSLENCATLIDHINSEKRPAPSIRDDVSDILMLRLAMDDIKSFYIEAALAETPQATPSSQQIQGWFWQETYAGTTLRQLREQLIQSEDKKIERLGRMFSIPHKWRLSP